MPLRKQLSLNQKQATILSNLKRKYTQALIIHIQYTHNNSQKVLLYNYVQYNLNQMQTHLQELTAFSIISEIQLLKQDLRQPEIHSSQSCFVKTKQKYKSQCKYKLTISWENRKYLFLPRRPPFKYNKMLLCKKQDNYLCKR